MKRKFARPRLLFEDYAVKLGDKLIISDLHIGIDSELGIRNPNSSDIMLSKLEKLSRVSCKQLIILGDVKHSIITIDRDIWFFFNTVTEIFDKVIIVKGNHDGRLEKVLKKYSTVVVHGSRGFSDGSNYFFHGHAYPNPSAYNCNRIFMGHLHPIDFSMESERAFFVCQVREFNPSYFAKERLQLPENSNEIKIEIIVLPSFNPVVPGKPNAIFTSKFFTNVFKDIAINVYSSSGIKTWAMDKWQRKRDVVERS